MYVQCKIQDTTVVRFFCNPRCNTDSYVVKASKGRYRSRTPFYLAVQGLLKTVLWVAKHFEVALKVAKTLVPLQPGPRFATDPFDSDPPTRESTAKTFTIPSSTMAVARRLRTPSKGPIPAVDATKTIDRCLCRLFFCFRKPAGRRRRFSRRT